MMLSVTAGPGGLKAAPARSVILLCTAGDLGGTQRVVTDLAYELSELGWFVDLYFPSDTTDPDLLDWCARQGVRATATPLLVDAASPHGLRTMWNLARLARTRPEAIVNIHYGDNFISAKDLLALRISRWRRRVVVTVHHPTSWDVSGRRKRWMTRLGARLASAVTVTTDVTAEMLHTAGIERSSISVVPCGVRPPPETVARSGRALADGERVVVGTLGRLVPHKRVDLLISSLASPDLGNAHLLVAGDGPERARLEDLARELLPERCTFVGRVPDVYEFFSRCDVFALASELEGFGLVYLEAALAGLPSVGTSTGGSVVAVAHGVTGLLVPPGDQEAMTSALRRLVTAADLRATMGEAAARRARSEFSARRMADDYAGVLANGA